LIEKDVTNPIMKYLKSKGCIIFKINDRSTSGIPDVMGITGDGTGRLIALEIKRPNRPSKSRMKLQEFNIKRFKELGGISKVVYSLDDVKELLNI